MFVKILKYLIPPIFVWPYYKAKSIQRRKAAEDPNVLFDGDDSLFKKVLEKTILYGEYGCGKSTKWVLNSSVADVIAVDTSKYWIEKVLADNTENNDRLNINHVDLGSIGDWGRPIDYSRREFFNDYTDLLWRLPKKPNTVLIDGRFRVCCFLTSLKYAAEGTYIIFDDYTDRPHYHIVEKYVDRVEECGRQCLFVVPSSDSINFEELEKDIVSFRHVMD